jgi:hypothetical protein
MKNVFLSEDEVFFAELCIGACLVNHTDRLFSRLSVCFAVNAALCLNERY